MAALVAVAAEELRHLGFERRLQQPGTEGGDLLEDVPEVTPGCEQLVDLDTDAVCG